MTTEETRQIQMSDVDNMTDHHDSSSVHDDNMKDSDIHDNNSLHDDTKPLPKRKSSVWVIVREKMSISEKGGTPVNWKMVALVFLSLFCSSMSLTFLFPFLPEMILYFGYKEVDKGYYAGMVASAVFFGRACGSYFWGWLSDKKGRKPVMLMTIFLNGISCFMFGFTVNLPMAIVCRFLSGLFNGTVGTAKTILYEISDNSNQAIGMSVLSVAWGSGIVLGPAIGGLLASPARRYPDVFDPEGFFGDFPYIIPSAFVLIVCAIGFILDIFFLPETLGMKNEDIKVIRKKKSKDDKLYLQDQDQNIGGEKSLGVLPKISMSVEDLHCESDVAMFQVQTDEKSDNVNKNKTCDGVSERSKLLLDRDHDTSQVTFDTDGDDTGIVISISDKNCDKHCVNGTYSDGEKHPLQRHSGNNTSLSSLSSRSKFKNMILFKLMRMPEVRVAVFLYAILSFAVIGHEEVFTVWASTEHGFDGLGFPPEKIGAALAASCIPLIVLNFYLFPMLVKRFKLKKSFIGCTLGLVFFVTLLPTLHLIQNNDTLLWVLLMVAMMPQKVLTSCCFSATSLFVNNSVTPEYAGSVNGIAMTITALVRTLAPIFGGSVYAWSIGYGTKYIGPPFDVSLVFFLFGLIVWGTAVYSVFMPKSLNKQKK